MPFWVFIIIGVVAFLLVSGLVVSLIITIPIANRIFATQWVRSSSTSFKRGCSDPSVPYHLDMFDKGMQFRETVLDHIKEVKIISCNLKLCGEYYDYGYDRAVILIPGRTETAHYGAFYASTFIEAGYNVLCIDARAHGLSEGTILTLGFEESKDIIEWSKFLHKEFNINHICLYGLCAGATCSCLTLLSKDCPSYVDSFIADGMFYTFYRVYARHVRIDNHKPNFPFTQLVMHKIKKICHVNPYKAAPKKLSKNINVPVLFLSGEKDIYALTKETKKMYDRCASKNKVFAFIKNGRHSHLKYDNQKDYEEAVISFLKNNIVGCVK